MSVSRKSVFILGGLVVLLMASLAVSRFGTGGLRPPASHAASFDLVALAKKARNAVVLIEVFDSGHNEVATGSGFFVSDNGLLITNAHVIENAASAAAKTESGDVLPIKGAIRIDRENDLAVLAVEGRNLPFLTLGQSEPLAVCIGLLSLG
jgi:S1-C subfamily serine protease